MGGSDCPQGTSSALAIKARTAFGWWELPQDVNAAA